ncbi:MAG: primosomal protein N' [Synechococcaceae cyanobacterium]|nr:primosomal protein N' [Synechococcaceae cyanobacterium]
MSASPGGEDPPLRPGWLEVWVEAGREGRVFTYANPRPLPIRPGDLVLVPLQGRRHAGLVVEVLPQRPPELDGVTILPVERVLQPAAVDPGWQALIDAVAETYHTSRFRTLKAALPGGWLGQRRQGQGDGGGRRLQWVERCGPEIVTDAGPAELRLLEALAAGGGCVSQRDLLAQPGVGRAALLRLEQRGLLRRELRPAGPAAPAPDRGEGDAALAAVMASPPRQLTPAQAAALQAIDAASPGQELLLWGVTGAGKTEVYLQAAARDLAAGRSVLLLTPEIGLIPQLLDRARERFGPRVLEYHSGMRDAERVTAWRDCLAGAERRQPQLAVGTRSAVFLPLHRVGLIVLDEEHDSSYKQDSPMPCYHAVTVARLRARHEGARLLLGSATPSLETWLSCRHGTTLLTLPQRIGARPSPPVRVVDLRQELADGHRRLISRPLMERLQGLRDRGEQAVVLVPRRGYRTFLSCRSCGEAVLCPHCDVSLTVHRRGDGREWLRCHWCDHRQEIAARCSHCHSTAFKPFGAGTQRVVEQLGAELSELRLLRFDADTTRGRDGHRRLLERFAQGEADVMVGTQMLAKGMDLPRVTLAAVLAADGLLHRPDLRSGESCLQLLLQLAGRAGRGELPGEVLVQTYSPDHPVMQHLIDGRYERFLDAELDCRLQAGLVPFSRACLLRLVGSVASATATAATIVAEQIRPELERAGWSLIGPAPAPVARVAGRSRWQLLLHGPWPPGTPPPSLPLPPEAALRTLLPREIGLTIDPDPQTL